MIGSQSIIHGDLNLENILLGPGDFLWLIDFAQTREGPPLFDFAHLEADLIAHVFAPRIDRVENYLALLEGRPPQGLEPLVEFISGAPGNWIPLPGQSFPASGMAARPKSCSHRCIEIRQSRPASPPVSLPDRGHNPALTVRISSTGCQVSSSWKL